MLERRLSEGHPNQPMFMICGIYTHSVLPGPKNENSPFLIMSKLPDHPASYDCRQSMLPERVPPALPPCSVDIEVSHPAEAMTSHADRRGLPLIAGHHDPD
jgi:hypothetical protein